MCVENLSIELYSYSSIYSRIILYGRLLLSRQFHLPLTRGFCFRCTRTTHKLLISVLVLCGNTSTYSKVLNRCPIMRDPVYGYSFHQIIDIFAGKRSRFCFPKVMRLAEFSNTIFDSFSTSTSRKYGSL